MATGLIGLYYHSCTMDSYGRPVLFTACKVTFQPALGDYFCFFNYPDTVRIPYGIDAYTTKTLPRTFWVNTKYGMLYVDLSRSLIQGEGLPEGFRALLIDGHQLVIGREPEVYLSPPPPKRQATEPGRDPMEAYNRYIRLSRELSHINLWGPFGIISPRDHPIIAGDTKDIVPWWTEDDDYDGINLMYDEDLPGAEPMFFETLDSPLTADLNRPRRKAKSIPLFLGGQIGKIVNDIAKSRTNYNHATVIRARIWLYLANPQMTVEEVAELVGKARSTVCFWKKKAKDSLESLRALEKLDPSKLKEEILKILRDAPRIGSPLQFPPEKVAEVIRIACTSPRTLKVPVNKWSIRYLHEYCCGKDARDNHGKPLEAHVFPKGERQPSMHAIRCMLERAKIKPWLQDYYIHSSDKYDKSELWKKKVCRITDLYMNQQEDTCVISIDEKTGIQAIEPKYEDKPLIPPKDGQPGKNRAREYEYIRHGTVSLTAGLLVHTGEVIIGKLGPTRTEEDFAEALEVWIKANDKPRLVIICDNLNTHKSEAAVRTVAKFIGFTGDLGKKGRSGILKTQESRQKFLEDESHSIRFEFTPNHCSWLNQIEIFFNILEHDVTYYTNVKSATELEELIKEYIAYHNTYHAHPYKWTKTGAMLTA